MKDVVHNYKVGNLRTHAEQSIGAANQLAIDLQSEVTAHLGLRERVTRGLLIIYVTAVGAGATLNILAQDSLDNSTYDADFATLTEIDATGVYIVDLKYFQRYLRLRATVATDAISWGAFFVGVDNQRAPVNQADATALTVTYATDRVAVA